MAATQLRAQQQLSGSVEPGQPLAVRTPDGLRLSARAYGDPGHPEIVLVHGLGQSRLSWELQTDSALVQRFRIVTFDLRGHGDSDKPDEAPAYADGARWADDLGAVIAAAKLRRPTLVGWSLGGLVIGHYVARRGIDGIGGINLVNAVTKLSPDLLTQTSLDYAGRLASPDLSARTEAIARFLAACFAEMPSAEAFARMLVFNGMVPRAVQQGVVRIGNDGLDEAFARAPRLLVTFGAKDALTRPEMSRRLLTLNPRATLSIYEQAGHTPFYEDAERFNRELGDFASS
ncbi:alpha/beta fold hydrolase [Enhydrobacter aerosaccus]|uniref:alpha/beta fold hydrolase n=1 Tax=Enhydrobacter aerosaccus TaxID=225324 RepID=UPI0014828B7F|nr:alpha/beta hydrolase [Enhydrobacter aerosaccus]